MERNVKKDCDSFHENRTKEARDKPGHTQD
jgi:hypothetical protein